MKARALGLSVNGKVVSIEATPRESLADVLRERLGLTSVHLGCEHGVCGACTVVVDGSTVRSCLMLAVASEGSEIVTLEGLESDELIDALRDSFMASHGLQCGFCTPAMLLAARDILQRIPDATEPTIRAELSGNLCRCTGYAGIVDAIRMTQTVMTVKTKGEADVRT